MIRHVLCLSNSVHSCDGHSADGEMKDPPVEKPELSKVLSLRLGGGKNKVFHASPVARISPF